MHWRRSVDLPYKDTQSIHNALYIEHNIQRIITQQEINGVHFNKTKARFLLYVLRERRYKLFRKIRPHLSLQLEVPYNKPVLKPFLKTGGYTASVKRWYDEPGQLSNVSGPFTRVTYVEPDFSKRGKLITQLLSLGWRPTQRTEKGNPKLIIEGQPCPSLSTISSSIGRQIGEWYVLRHREGQIISLLGLVREDNRISAEAITIGTPTYRFRHKGLVNIPRLGTLFGRQMRSLFDVKDRTRRLVGYDASQLELRMLAHYINDEEYTKEVNSGDIHTRNQKDAGLATRDEAKTFIYAFNYGAGDRKIGSIVGGSQRKGKLIRQAFLEKNPKLRELITNSQSAAKRGYLVGLDGRKLHLRRDPVTREIQTHKALNTLLQSGGAVVMKWTMVLLDSWLRQYKLDTMKVIDMHDEGQQDTLLRDAQMVGRLACMAITEVGRLLKLNIPLTADYKVGTNWSHTH